MSPEERIAALVRRVGAVTIHACPGESRDMNWTLRHPESDVLIHPPQASLSDALAVAETPEFFLLIETKRRAPRDVGAVRLWIHDGEARRAAESARDALLIASPGDWRPISADTAFAPPFGTIRVCRGCGCLVAGGPTSCVRCFDEVEE